MTIPMEKFGKDHWSTFCYAETRAVDFHGKLDRKHLRTDGDKHPTQLRGAKLERGHDDLDCIADMEAAGLLENRGSGLFPRVELTDEGWRVAGQLRRWKADGGQFSGFEVTP